jgi:hypothetical protein
VLNATQSSPKHFSEEGLPLPLNTKSRIIAPVKWSGKLRGTANVLCVSSLQKHKPKHGEGLSIYHERGGDQANKDDRTEPGHNLDWMKMKV